MSVIDDYLNNLTEPEKAALERIRKIVHKILPDAEEVITYKMPGFKYKNKYLVAFAEFKDHLSIFPGNEAIASVKSELSGFKTSKGTLQFTQDMPIPEKTIIKILKHRAKEIDKKSS